MNRDKYSDIIFVCILNRQIFRALCMFIIFHRSPDPVTDKSDEKVKQSNGSGDSSSDEESEEDNKERLKRMRMASPPRSPSPIRYCFVTWLKITKKQN